jgi:hypothetical protein
MSSRRKAGRAAARPNDPSRRTMMIGCSVSPLVIGESEVRAETDPPIALCYRWLAVEAERRRLQTAWSNHEAWLIKNRRWFQLSKSEQAAIPEGARLAEIDARLDVLGVKGQTLLKAMRPTPAPSITAVTANLSVAAGLLFEEDHPQAHGLITRAIHDLAAFSGGK